MHGVVVASNRQVRVVFHRELGFKYQSLPKRINLGQRESEGRRIKLLKQINKKGLVFMISPSDEPTD